MKGNWKNPGVEKNPDVRKHPSGERRTIFTVSGSKKKKKKKKKKKNREENRKKESCMKIRRAGGEKEGGGVRDFAPVSDNLRGGREASWTQQNRSSSTRCEIGWFNTWDNNTSVSLPRH